MTSLSEAYGGRGRSGVDPRRLYVGVASFVAGTLLLVVGLFVAAEVLIPADYTAAEARRLGGILGGVGLPVVLLGVMAVLPADRSTYAASIVGGAVMCLGVALFAYAYPYHWVGGPRPELTDLTLPTAGLFFLGAATALWSVFVGVANFKTRNDPGGTVTMEVTHKGETKVVEVSRGQLENGGVGLLGGTPDGDVETQTNRPGTTRTGPTVGGRSSASVSDGGSDAAEITSPLDRDASSPPASETLSPDTPSSPDGPGDAYCGNCERFDYVRTDDGMQPYCAHYDELMDDMEACEEWTPR